MRGMREEKGGERERKRGKDRGERKQKGRKEGRKKVFIYFFCVKDTKTLWPFNSSSK